MTPIRIETAANSKPSGQPERRQQSPRHAPLLQANPREKPASLRRRSSRETLRGRGGRSGAALQLKTGPYGLELVALIKVRREVVVTLSGLGSSEARSARSMSAPARRRPPATLPTVPERSPSTYLPLLADGWLRHRAAARSATGPPRSIRDLKPVIGSRSAWSDRRRWAYQGAASWLLLVVQNETGQRAAPPARRPWTRRSPVSRLHPVAQGRSDKTSAIAAVRSTACRL